MDPDPFEKTIRIENPLGAAAGDGFAADERARLVVLKGAERGRIYELHGASCTIGRSLDNNVVLLSAAVSKNHARLEQEGGAVRLLDLGSTNGTRRNHSRLKPGQAAALDHGDLLEIGDQTLLFCHAGRLERLEDLVEVRFNRDEVRREVDALLKDFPGRRD